MPRNTGGIRSRPSFRPGGSNYTNLSYTQDLECKDLHAFGNTVCNGESRIQGNVMSGGLHVGDSGVLKVPVIAGGTAGNAPTSAPTMAGLVVVKSVAGADKDEPGLFYSRLEKNTADESTGANIILAASQSFITANTNSTTNVGPSAAQLKTYLDDVVAGTATAPYNNALTGKVKDGADKVIAAFLSQHGNTDAGTSEDEALPLIQAKVAELAEIASKTFEWVAAN